MSSKLNIDFIYLLNKYKNFFFRFLNDLRPFAPNEQEYKKLSFLLTLKRLQDHTDYHNWNPSAGRVQCFHEVFPVVHRFLQVKFRDISNSSD